VSSSVTVNPTDDIMYMYLGSLNSANTTVTLSWAPVVSNALLNYSLTVLTLGLMLISYM
jgi:hypothetical protein